MKGLVDLEGRVEVGTVDAANHCMNACAPGSASDQGDSGLLWGHKWVALFCSWLMTFREVCRWNRL